MMLIRELEQMTGLDRATIRFYEREGLITPTRAENGYRTYGEADCDTLLKVKLLRQLGMPLERIKELQQGSADLSDVLTEQIAALEKQIQDSSRAREVCLEMKERSSTYTALDARYYLDELKKPSATWKPQPVPEFHQKVPLHPWRRYFARRIDLLILRILIFYLFTVVLRIRPINSIFYTLVGLEIVSHLALVPIEGLLLHRWGTTPGKWVMGIRVETVNGGNLLPSVAMMRAWAILKDGFGYTIPVYGLWTQYQSYKEYIEDGSVFWDRQYETEIQFDEQFDLRKKILIAMMAAAMAICIGLTVHDGLKPVHRGSDLTVAQFAENYNDLVELRAIENNLPIYETNFLTPEGKWYTSENGMFMGTTLTSNYPGPEFLVENGTIDAIIYRVSYGNIMALEVFETQPMNLVMTAVQAQDWVSFGNYSIFADRFKEACQAENGTFIFENLEITWETHATNCTYSGALFMQSNAEELSTLEMTIEIHIHDQ